MTPPQIMNLDSFLARVQLKQTRVDSARTALADAEFELRTTKEIEKANVIQALNRGETSGSPLKDQMLRHFGLEKEPVENVLAFSNRLVTAKGQYALFCAISSEPFMHVMAPTPTCRSTDRTVGHFVLGKLTGEPFEAFGDFGDEKVLAPFFRLPFSAFVTWSSDEDPKKKENGPLVLDQESMASFASNSITNSSLLTIVAYPKLGAEQSSFNLRYYIGPLGQEENGGLSQAIKAIGIISGLMDVRQALEILETDPADLETSGSS